MVMETTGITTATWMLAVLTDTTMTMGDVTWSDTRLTTVSTVSMTSDRYLPRNFVFLGFLFKRELRAEPRAAIFLLQEN